MSTDQADAHDALKKLDAEQIEAIADLPPEDIRALKRDRASRRDLLKGGGALLAGAVVGAGGREAVEQSVDRAAADASTSDGDWDIGDPNNRGDVFADGVDALSVRTVEATIDNSVVRQGTDADRTRYVGDTVSVSGGATEVIFDLTDPVDIITGNIIGMDLADVTVTYGDGTTEQLYPSRFLGKDQGGDYQSVVPLPPVKSVTKLTFTNNASNSNSFGWGVMTI